MWLWGLDYIGLVLISAVFCVIILVLIFLLSNIGTRVIASIKMPFDAGTYYNTAMKYRRKGIIILLLLFISIGFILSWTLNGPNTYAAYSSELLSEPYDTNQQNA